LKNTLSFLQICKLALSIVHPLFPGSFGTLKELGLAMINCVRIGSEKRVLDTKDIAELAMKS